MRGIIEICDSIYESYTCVYDSIYKSFVCVYAQKNAFTISKHIHKQIFCVCT